MRNRQRRSIRWGAALLLALSFSARVASADLAGDKKDPGKDNGKGKAGAACKADSDCDQSGRPQRCRDSKCEARPVHPVT